MLGAWRAGVTVLSTERSKRHCRPHVACRFLPRLPPGTLETLLPTPSGDVEHLHYQIIMSHSHSHESASHSHAAADHGHTHEILDGPGSFHGREMPIIHGRDWEERSFTIGIGGYACPSIGSSGSTWIYDISTCVRWWQSVQP